MEIGAPELAISSQLFPFQAKTVDWAIRQGECALFEDCVLGKTIQQLEWARHVHAKTQRPVLILCPVAVRGATVAEGCEFGISVTHARDQDEVVTGINIANFGTSNTGGAS